MEYRCRDEWCKKQAVYRKLVEAFHHRINYHNDEVVSIDRFTIDDHKQSELGKWQ